MLNDCVRLCYSCSQQIGQPFLKQKINVCAQVGEN